ncbi:hypothetical protein WG906_04970 [Pedobacter sp. P351]|uniref:hypothetical protein n=1 Tax=Pedobacter superstes TaxID=3133441 RepID=UPI0030B75AD4
MNSKDRMQNSEYQQNIEMGLTFFHNLQFEMFAFAFSLLFAGELKDVGDNVHKDEPLILDPDLLAMSTDKNVQLLGALSKSLSTKTATLANLSRNNLKTETEILRNTEPKKTSNSSPIEDNDYDKMFLKCVGILIEYSFGIVVILETFVSKASDQAIDIKGRGADLIDRIDTLRPYSDINMTLLLDMAASLESTLSQILFEDASGRGLLKDKSALELIDLFKGE